MTTDTDLAAIVAHLRAAELVVGMAREIHIKAQYAYLLASSWEDIGHGYWRKGTVVLDTDAACDAEDEPRGGAAMKPLPGQRDLFGGGRSALPQYDAAREADVCRCFVLEAAERCPVHDAVPLNSTVAPEDAPRLSQQHHEILARLREGPATGPQLAEIAIRYSARLEEIGKAGHAWAKRPIGGGQFEYRLIDRGGE